MSRTIIECECGESMPEEEWDEHDCIFIKEQRVENMRQEHKANLWVQVREYMEAGYDQDLEDTHAIGLLHLIEDLIREERELYQRGEKNLEAWRAMAQRKKS